MATGAGTGPQPEPFTAWVADVASSPLAPLLVAVGFLLLGTLYILYNMYKTKQSRTDYYSPAFCYPRRDRRYERMYAAALPHQEWYGLDDAMLAIVKEMISCESDHIHDLGCGQSNLCEQLRAHGFTSLSASDFSAVLIGIRRLAFASAKIFCLCTVDSSHRRFIYNHALLLSKCIHQRTEKRQGDEKKRAAVMGDSAPIIKYVTCDLRERAPMPIKSVKLIVDKATLDAITHRQSGNAASDARRVLNEAVKMLSDDGKLLSISLSNDNTFEKYCTHPSLTPITATRRIVRRIAGQPKPVNVYIRKFKLALRR
eukprot:jgi/Bigna1/88976/estExt_fgenesh1_pg.C_410114